MKFASIKKRGIDSTSVRRKASCLAWVGAVLALVLCVSAPVAAESEAGATQGTWIAEVFHGSVESVVRVECGEAIGTGFFFHSPRHVATAFHVIQSSRDITVYFSDGAWAEAQVVAFDPFEDLAILEVHSVRAVRPLVPAPLSTLTVGDPVLALGTPMDLAVRQAHRSDLPIFTTTVGYISVATSEAVQTDAAINPGNSGGPLLDQRGRVVGVITRKVADGEGLGFAAPIDKLVRLTGSIGQGGPFIGWLSGDLLLGYGFADHHLDGFQVGLQILAYDRVGVTGRFGWFSRDAAFDGDYLINERDRDLIELSLFYRLSAYAPPYLALHLPIGVGMASTSDEIVDTRLVAQTADPGCNVATESCTLLTSGQRDKSRDTRWRPMLTVGLELPPLELSSALYFQKDEPLGWRFGIGLVF